ncbi:MAG: glycosyltransferase [Solirubrobacteraceae bacterium MAG38_C4-C5]|nr:glycosyltransferase [Candidatus Siliceabacter maunaloa]
MRILLVSQMYPGPGDPDLGTFVAQLERELGARGHAIDRVAVDRRGGPRTKHAAFGIRVLAAALRRRPDVVYAHFLAPAGVLAVGAGALIRRPIVLTAHGQDVRNAAAMPAVRRATAWACARASAVVCVSDALRRELEAAIPAAAGRTHVISCGVDLERFAPRTERGEAPRGGQVPRTADPATAPPRPRFLFVGSLVERKNVVALADAFATLGAGSLTLLGDGPLRMALEGRPGVRLAGRVGHDEVPAWIADCDVLCLPSLTEPFGMVLLEAMAMERSVVATRVGGPPEFVPPSAGVLVDPHDVTDIARGLREAAALPRPNPAARESAAGHDLRRQVERIEAVLAEAVSRRR